MKKRMAMLVLLVFLLTSCSDPSFRLSKNLVNGILETAKEVENTDQTYEFDVMDVEDENARPYKVNEYSKEDSDLGNEENESKKTDDLKDDAEIIVNDFSYEVVYEELIKAKEAEYKEAMDSYFENPIISNHSLEKWEGYSKTHPDFKQKPVGEIVEGDYIIALGDFGEVETDTPNEYGSYKAFKMTVSFENKSDHPIRIAPYHTRLTLMKDKYYEPIPPNVRETQILEPGDFEIFEFIFPGEADMAYKNALYFSLPVIEFEANEDGGYDIADVIGFTAETNDMGEVRVEPNFVDSNFNRAYVRANITDTPRAIEYGYYIDPLGTTEKTSKYWKDLREENRDFIDSINEFVEVCDLYFAFGNSAKYYDDIDGIEKNLMLNTITIENNSGEDLVFNPQDIKLYDITSKKTLNTYEPLTRDEVKAYDKKVNEYWLGFKGDEILNNKDGFIYIIPPVFTLDGEQCTDELYLKFYNRQGLIPTYEVMSKTDVHKEIK